jgi:nitrogen regulatory protein PII
MLKVVVAYIDSGMFEPIRNDLADCGITTTSAIAAGGAGSERFAAPHYKGSPYTQHLVEKLRLECVVGARHVQTVTEAVFRHVGKKTFLFVMDVELAMPEDSILADSSEAIA